MSQPRRAIYTVFLHLIQSLGIDFGWTRSPLIKDYCFRLWNYMKTLMQVRCTSVVSLRQKGRKQSYILLHWISYAQSGNNLTSVLLCWWNSYFLHNSSVDAGPSWYLVEKKDLPSLTLRQTKSWITFSQLGSKILRKTRERRGLFKPHRAF